MMSTKLKESLGKALFIIMATICIIAVISIFAFLIVKSIPAFSKIGVIDFIFGDMWAPQRGDSYDMPLKGSYGIFTMILGTALSTVGALIIGGILGYFTSVFIVFYCPDKLKRVGTLVINILSGIPSVIYGFFGITILLPLLSLFAPNNGSGLLATSIILGIMILPTVVSLSKVALEAVPRRYYEGSAALGVSHTETVFKIMVPSAKNGIVAALVLGVGRALGETMAVIMVAGNSPTYPNGLFGSIRVMTANIVLEMGYAGQVQEGALIATGVVLLAFILMVNLVFNLVCYKAVEKIVNKPRKSRIKVKVQKIKEVIDDISYKVKLAKIGEYVSLISAVAVSLILVTIISFVLIKGIPTLVAKPSLIFGKFEFGSKNITIFPPIVCTLMLVVISIIVSAPIGIMTAIFLNEYARKDSYFVRIVRGSINILSGVPSIVYGLFGMITFVRIFGGHSSIIAGSLTVSIMLLPIIVRATEESLKNVENSIREASLALGAGKLRTILKVVLPSATAGIFSAIILSIGRAISESAPLLYTMGSVIKAVPTGIFDSGATLAVALYQLSGEGWYINESYATAVVLIIFVLGLNFLMEIISRRKNEGKSK